MKYGTRATKH